MEEKNGRREEEKGWKKWKRRGTKYTRTQTHTPFHGGIIKAVRCQKSQSDRAAVQTRSSWLLPGRYLLVIMSPTCDQAMVNYTKLTSAPPPIFMSVSSPLHQEISRLPEMISQTPLARVWFKQDDEYKLPKAVVYTELFR